jgi:hypothetical protein
MRWSEWSALALILAASNADAQSGAATTANGTPWLLMLGAQIDEKSYRNVLADFELGLGEATWLSIVAGSSEAPDVKPAIQASLVSIGVEHDFGPVGIGLMAEQWGDSGNLETSDWRGDLFFRRERFRVGLTYENRAIDIFFSAAPLLPDIRRFRIDASGIGINGRLRIAEDWQIYGQWMDYDYPNRLRLVPRADRVDLLSASAVTLAYSLSDHYAGFGVERSFGGTLLNVDFGQDRSAVDGEILESISASVLWPAARRLDLEFTLGQSRIDGFGSTLFGGLSVLIYGN